MRSFVSKQPAGKGRHTEGAPIGDDHAHRARGVGGEHPLAGAEAPLHQVSAPAVEAERSLRGDDERHLLAEEGALGRRLAAPVARLLPGARAHRHGEHAPVGERDPHAAPGLGVEHALAELEGLAEVHAGKAVDGDDLALEHDQLEHVGHGRLAGRTKVGAARGRRQQAAKERCGEPRAGGARGRACAQLGAGGAHGAHRRRPGGSRSVIVPAASSAARPRVSESVGWGWMARARSSASLPSSMATTASAISSPAREPTMPAPTRRPVCFEQQLGEALAAPEAERAAVRRPGEDRLLHLDAALPRLALGEPGPRHLGIGVGHRRDRLRVEGRREPGDHLGGHLRPGASPGARGAAARSTSPIAKTCGTWRALSARPPR